MTSTITPCSGLRDAECDTLWLAETTDSLAAATAAAVELVVVEDEPADEDEEGWLLRLLPLPLVWLCRWEELSTKVKPSNVSSTDAALCPSCSPCCVQGYKRGGGVISVQRRRGADEGDTHAQKMLLGGRSTQKSPHRGNQNNWNEQRYVCAMRGTYVNSVCPNRILFFKCSASTLRTPGLISVQYFRLMTVPRNKCTSCYLHFHDVDGCIQYSGPPLLSFRLLTSSTSLSSSTRIQAGAGQM